MQRDLRGSFLTRRAKVSGPLPFVSFLPYKLVAGLFFGIMASMDTQCRRDHLSSEGRKSFRGCQLSSLLVLGLLASLVFLSACSGLVLTPQETVAFSFEAPSGETRATVEKTQATSQQEAPAVSPETSEAPQATQAPAQDLKDAEAATSSNLDRPTNPFTAQARIPLYARLEDADINQEEAVPLSVPRDNPIRGVAGTRVERFFRILSVNPVTYHYAVLPSEGDLLDAEDIDVLEVYIALKDDLAYMRIDTKDSALALLQLSSSTHYQMDLIAGTYEILPGLSTKSNELSMEAFRQLESNAASFINTGTGQGVFFGQRVTYEEFTADGASYVRYYFVGDVLVGHRRFEDGKIVRTVRVFEASNRYDDDVFQIPEGLKQVSPGETLADAQDN